MLVSIGGALAKFLLRRYLGEGFGSLGASLASKNQVLSLSDIKFQRATTQILKFYRARLSTKAVVDKAFHEVRIDKAVERRVMEDEIYRGAQQSPRDEKLWQNRVPFLIRLRDCPRGQIPSVGEWVSHTSKFAGDPPSGWIEEILKSGRGLVIFDGVDEVPVFDRSDVGRGISDVVAAHPNNLFVVTTRPAAVPEKWLSSDQFVEARVDPLSTDERNELITRWHSALELTGLYTSDELTEISRKLISEIETVPQIAQIAINPLLCAMVCALNIDRKGQLPKNHRDLCSALVEALLHRRDAEQKIPLEGLPPRSLDDVQLISSLGDEIVDDLAETIPRDVEAAKALARILAQIGTRKAIEKAKAFLRERRPTVLIELIDVINAVQFEYIRTQLMSGSALDPNLAQRITRIENSGGLARAKKLDFSNCGISDFTFLQECSQLERLSLHNTKIFDAEIVGKCTKLKSLDVSNTFITDFGFLKHLGALETLDVSWTPVDSLDVLADLNVQYLNLWNTDLHHLHPVVRQKLAKVNTNSGELTHQLRAKIMDRKQAERVFAI